MNSDAEVIKEFLVSVGVKLDEGTFSKFDNIIAKIGGKVLGFAAIIGGAALATEKFVDHVATNLEDLYWASQRLHSSVSQIQDYGLAIKNLGGDANEARGSLENIARTLRTNPGYSGFLSSLGVNPGQGTVGIAKNLVSSLKSKGMPYFLAQRYGEMFGIDESTFWAEWNDKGGGINKTPYGDAYKNANTNVDKAAASAQQLEQQMRDVGVQTSVLAVNMMTHLLPAVQAVNAAILRNSPNTLKHTDRTGATAGDALAHPMKFVHKIAKNYSDISTGIIEYVQQFIPGALPDLIFGIAKRAGYDSAHSSAIAATVIAESGGNPQARGDYDKSGHPTAFGAFQFRGSRVSDFKRWAGFDITDKRATLEKQIEFFKYEMDQGNERRAGFAFNKAKTAQDAAKVLTRMNLRPAAPERDAAIRAGYATKIEMHQKTDIHVAAGKTANETGKTVANHQNRVNGDLLRNLKGVVQ